MNWTLYAVLWASHLRLLLEQGKRADNGQDIYTAAEAAAKLKLTEEALYGKVAEGKLREFRGSSKSYERSEVDKLADSSEILDAVYPPGATKVETINAGQSQGSNPGI